MGGGASKEKAGDGEKAVDAASAKAKMTPRVEPEPESEPEPEPESEPEADRNASQEAAAKASQEAAAAAEEANAKVEEARAKVEEAQAKADAGDESAKEELVKQQAELAKQQAEADQLEQMAKETAAKVEPAAELEPEPELEPLLTPEEIELNAMAAKLQLTRAVIDPLHERFVELADEHKVLHKKDLVTAIPALAASPFYTAVFGLLRNGAPSGAVAEEGGLSASQTVAEEAFIAALAKFDHSAPLDSKLRSMFYMFRGAEQAGGGVAVGMTPDDIGELRRKDLQNLVNTVYSTETQTMVEVLTTGLMNALDPGKTGKVAWADFKQACEDIEGIEQMLTISWPTPDSAGAPA